MWASTYDNCIPSNSASLSFFSCRHLAMAFLSPSPLRLPLSVPPTARTCSLCALNPSKKRRRPAPFSIAATAAGDTFDEEPQSTPQSQNSPATIFSKVADSIAEFFYAPLASCSVISRQWQCVGGNYILRPSIEPKAVIHFIGGAFIGATPQIVYRTFLEKLVARGYLVVATPYNLTFDYMDAVASIADSWTTLRNKHLSTMDLPDIPVIGVGHSAGALFQSLGSSLFLDDFNRRTANVLISFNNMQASDAIPVYKDLFAPAFSQLVQMDDSIPIPQDFRDTLYLIPNALEDFIMGNSLTPNRVRENFLPTVQESRKIFEQIAPLIREIGNDGEAPEFYPTPHDCQAAVENLYDIPNTLIVSFESDTIDDSAKLEEMIREKAKRSRGDVMNITSIKLRGTHITPLAQDIPNANGNSLGKALQSLADGAGGSDMNKLVQVLDSWIDDLP